MSTKANKAVAQQLFEDVSNQGNLEAIDDIVAEHVLGHDATSSKPKRGSESYRQVAILFQTAFPDAEYRLHDLIAEGDKVVTRWAVQCTHRGTFMGVPPTQKQLRMNGIIIYRLEDQKIVEYWGNCDIHGLMQQLEAIPALE